MYLSRRDRALGALLVVAGVLFQGPWLGRAAALLSVALVSSFVSTAVLLAQDVYFTPFSHLDFYWGGTREECLARGNEIIAKAITLAKRSPDFRFMLEDDDFVANYVESHKGSAELADFKRLVKEGRIDIAPKWAAIFQGLPDGEVHVRNLLIGKQFARTVFGVDPQVAHLGDLPDYTPQYPQILAKSDVPFMVMTRMGPSDTSLFRWKAPDGSTALVWNTLKGYGWGTFLTSKQQTDDQKAARLKKDLAEVRATTDGPLMMNWGTDLWAPPDDLVEAVAAANRMGVGRFLISTPTDFFRRVVEDRGNRGNRANRPLEPGAWSLKPADIPELSGEINSSWPNIVSSLPHLWPYEIPATNTLLAAEKFSTINYALGYAEYPQAQLDLLWKKLIESMDHNHDGQGGSVGDERKRSYATMSVLEGGEILRDMLRNIAERVRIPTMSASVPAKGSPAKSFPIVVFNTLSWSRDDVVRAHVTLYGDVAPGDIAAFKQGLRLVDETGASIVFHVERYSENISRALELVFIAHGVPALGYKTYFLVADPHPEPQTETAELKLDRENDQKDPRRALGADVMENDLLRVTIDKATGHVTLFDKVLGHNICQDMEIAAVEERGGNYIGIEPPSGRTIYNVVRAVDLEENNAIRATMRISGEVAGVPVSQRLTLYRGLRRLDIENTVEWKEPRFVRLEQWFPLEQRGASMTYGVPFGANAAENIIPKAGMHQSDEIKPESWRQARHIHDWIHAAAGASGGTQGGAAASAAGSVSWGITLGTDHQFVKIGDDLLRAEMVRGTRFTSVKVVQGTDVSSLFYPPPDTYVFRYSLSAGRGDWKSAKAWRAGMAFNNPLIPVSVVDAISQKSLPPTHSFVSLKADNVVISTLKKAESGPAVLLRAYEIEGAPAESPVEFLGQTRRFREVNLLEEETSAQEQQLFQARPYEIKTIRIH